VKVRAQFVNADNAVFPNQFVNAQLLLKTLHNVVTVPTAAIQRGAPGSYVYVINADNRVSVRPVNIGPTDGPIAAVNSGVSVGERFVVDGTDRSRDGGRVIMPAAPSQAPAADPPSNAQNPQPQNPSRMRSPKAPVIRITPTTCAGCVRKYAISTASWRFASRPRPRSA
jgi:membrane fusion protein, multidrug efflux system